MDIEVENKQCKWLRKARNHFSFQVGIHKEPEEAMVQWSGKGSRRDHSSRKEGKNLEY